MLKSSLRNLVFETPVQRFLFGHIVPSVMTNSKSSVVVTFKGLASPLTNDSWYTSSTCVAVIAICLRKMIMRKDCRCHSWCGDSDWCARIQNQSCASDGGKGINVGLKTIGKSKSIKKKFHSFWAWQTIFSLKINYLFCIILLVKIFVNIGWGIFL